jgi:hypothetical protein
VSVLAAGLAGLSIQQGVSAHRAYASADAMVRPGGILSPGVSAADHDAAVRRGDTASRTAWITGTSAVVSAAGAGILWWLSR